MEQVNYTAKSAKYKHLTERDRYLLEGYLEIGLPVKKIAQKLNSHLSTVYREINRGRVNRIKSDITEYQVYRANTAHTDYEKKVTHRAHSLKIEKYKEIATYIREKILKDKYSPDVIIGESMLFLVETPGSPKIFTS